MLQHWQQDSFPPINHQLLQPQASVSVRERSRQKRLDARREVEKVDRAMSGSR